ncbi:MAG: hypothetical protein IEMM0002_0714 [bacterium]|nr:MAG: hypothetical protein IEMM0002_0714 [bacterium]
MKVGLALGGGAARGIAHMGVLMELEKAKIPIDVIVGTSIGALLGGMYAINPNAEEVKGKLLGFFQARSSTSVTWMSLTPPRPKRSGDC